MAVASKQVSKEQLLAGVEKIAEIRKLAEAIAKANGHPDAKGWAQSVVDHFTDVVPKEPAPSE
jgi:hypothetical protein